MESEVCQYCGTSGGHSPECQTQMKSSSENREIIKKGPSMREVVRSQIGERFFDPRRFKDNLEDYKVWSKGEVISDELKGIREKHYPGWTDRDFAALMKIFDRETLDKLADLYRTISDKMGDDDEEGN